MTEKFCAVFIVNCGKDLRRLVWMFLTYKAINLTPDGIYELSYEFNYCIQFISLVGEWLRLIFRDLQLDSFDLSKSDPDMLCLCDLEVIH